MLRNFLDEEEEKALKRYIVRIQGFFLSVHGYSLTFIAIALYAGPYLNKVGLKMPSLGTLASLYFSGLLAVLYYQQKQILEIENKPHLEVDGLRELDEENNRILQILLSNVGNGVATDLKLHLTTDVLGDEVQEESRMIPVVRSDLDDEEWFQENSRSSYLNPDENQVVFLTDLDLYLRYGGLSRVPLVSEEGAEEDEEQRLRLKLQLHYEDLAGQEHTEEFLDNIGPIHSDIGFNEFLRRSFPRSAYEEHKQSFDDEYDPIDVAEGKPLQDRTKNQESKS